MKKYLKLLSLIGVSLLLTGCNRNNIEDPDTPNNPSDPEEPITPSEREFKTYQDIDEYMSTSGLTPSKGNVNILVVPVEFSDLSEFDNETLNMIDDTFNSTNPTYFESVKSYYQTSSYNKLNFNFTLCDPYTSIISSTNFKRLETNGINGTTRILNDMYNKLTINGESVNYSNYDSDLDGYVDGVWLIYNNANANEVFNQSVAKKVTKLLHSKGIYLIDDPNKSQIEDSSLYEMGEFLLKGFFELFYNDILELYNSPGGLDKFYSKIDVTELTFLGKLLHEYLKRSDILDIKDSENLEYEKRAKEIMDRIKHNSKKDKIYEVVSLLDLNDLNDITPEKIKFAYEETLNIFNELDNLELKNKIHFVLLESLKYALENIEEIKSIQGITTNKTNAEMYGIQKIEIFKTLNKKNPLILNTIVTNLEASGISVNNIIKTIHSLEYGLVIPGVMRKLIELFGENTYLTLMKFNETEQNDYETRETLCSQLENSIVSILNSQIRK